MIVVVAAETASPTLDLDFQSGQYTRAGQAAAALTDISGVAAVGAGGIALTPDGRLLSFPNGELRQDATGGVLVEPASENRCTSHNAAPISHEGWSVRGRSSAASVITVADRTSGLQAARDEKTGSFIFRDLLRSKVMDGRVLVVRNPDPSDDLVIVSDGPVGTTDRCAVSAWVRCVSGAGDIGLESAPSASFDTRVWARVARPGLSPRSPAARLTLTLRPGAEIEVILWQLEPNAVPTSPIVVAGSTAARTGDTLRIVDVDLFKRPFTILTEGCLPRGDSAVRRWLTLSSRDAEISVTRTRDDALTLSGTGPDHETIVLPCIPRIQGPGSVRVALQVKPQGRVVSAGGANAYDAFNPFPEGLDTLVVGAAADGSLPLTGWIRRISVAGLSDAVDLAAATAPPIDAMPHDIFRYVDPAGDDAADGLTQATAWAKLAKVAATVLPSGAQILLKRGGSWSETLYPPVRWSTIGAYGVGERPIVGVGRDFGFDENDKDGVRVQDLHFRDFNVRGWNNLGSDSHMLWNCEIGPTTPGQPEANHQGVASRSFRNFYIGACHIHDVMGDDVFLQKTTGGWVISEANRYDTPQGGAADCFQISQNEGARWRLSGDVYDMRSAVSNSGNGCVVIVGGRGGVLEDFVAHGLNFAIGIDSDDVTIRRGHISGSNLHPYSWGVGSGGTDDVRNHLYEDLVIEGCNRGITCSGFGHPPEVGPKHIDMVARRVSIKDCGVGLFIDRPTSGDLSGVTFEGCQADVVVRVAVVPPGGSYDRLVLPPTR
ncbi:hypothetical protein BH10PSE2_BH10PSE2_10050 [soil metagenome]